MKITFICTDGQKSSRMAWYFKEYYRDHMFTGCGIDPFLCEVEGNPLLTDDVIKESDGFIVLDDTTYQFVPESAKAKIMCFTSVDVLTPEQLLRTRKRINHLL